MPLNLSEILNNRYRIIKLLGQGGYGAVYRAWDLNLQKSCAVKENLDVSPELSSQFMREATTLANLSHPNLPRVIDHFSLPGRGQYMVMDFVEGENLESMVVRGGPVPYQQAVTWIGQIADALVYLHNQTQPLIHRDIKPANIIINPAGQAMLVDFGLVKVFEKNTKTVQGARGVTPGYSPPEQYGEGKTDARTDTYSLGATLYTLLTGLVPPQSVDIMAGAEKPPLPVHQLNAQIPVELGEAIQRSMQLDSNKRYQSVSDFKAAIFSSIPTMNMTRMHSQPGSAGPYLQPQPAIGVSAAARPPSSPARPGSRPAGTPSRPAGRKGWALFGAGGCILGILLLVLGGAGVWGLYTYTDALAFLKPPTPTLTPSPTPTFTPVPPTSTPTNTPTETLEPTNTPTPTEPPRLTPLPYFTDDFSNPDSGWDRVNLTNRITDYQDGFYRIRVNDPNSDVWGNPDLNAYDTIVEVDTFWYSGSFDNDFGIICRYQDVSNFYFGTISNDGDAAIYYLQNGHYNILGTDGRLSYPAINQGDAYNHIRFDCVGDTLTLYANGQQLISTIDASLGSGDVGLIAGTFDEGGVEIYFDNFVVYLP